MIHGQSVSPTTTKLITLHLVDIDYSQVKSSIHHTNSLVLHHSVQSGQLMWLDAAIFVPGDTRLIMVNNVLG